MKEVDEHHPCPGVWWDGNKQAWRVHYEVSGKWHEKMFYAKRYGYVQGKKLAMERRRTSEHAHSNALADVQPSSSSRLLPLARSEDDTADQSQSKSRLSNNSTCCRCTECSATSAY